MLTNGRPKSAPEIPAIVQPLLKEFEELFSGELLQIPIGLPSMHDI